MMILDNNGRIKGKVSIIDLAVMLLIVGVMFGVLYKFVLVDKVAIYKDMNVMIYKTEVKAVKQMAVDAVEVGMELKEGITLDSIGIIIDKEVVPAMRRMQKADGTYVMAQSPDRFDITLTIKAQGIEKDEGHFIYGKRNVVVGGWLRFKAPLVVMESNISFVEYEK